MSEDRNIFQKIGDAVVDYAPGIATVLAATGIGAPIAAAVGAVGALGKAFGLGSNAKPEEVLAVISVDPEIRLKAMIAENDFKVKMRDLEIREMQETTKRLEARLLDIQSARTMNVEGMKATGKRDVEDKVFDWIIVTGLFVIIGAMMALQPPESTNLGLCIGAVISAFLSIVAYRKGSSASGNEKTAMIYNSTPNVPKKEI